MTELHTTSAARDISTVVGEEIGFRVFSPAKYQPKSWEERR